jgi:hypothetical protein
MKKGILLGALALVTLTSSANAWTKSDCYNAWRHNMTGCNTSPPNLRPACWAAASALLAACLAASQG